MPHGTELWPEAVELLEVALASAGGDGDCRAAVRLSRTTRWSLAVGSTPDQAGGFGPVDELDGAVVPEQEDVGDVADRRPARSRLTADGEQQLVLRRGETDRRGLFLAPVQEAAQAGPELEETLVVSVGKLVASPFISCHDRSVVASASVVSRRARARRTAFLSAIAAVLGVIGGGAAWVLLHLIGLITNVVLFHQWGWTLPSFANFHPGPILFVEAAAGALVVSLLGALVARDPRPRHPGGDGVDPHAPEPHRTAGRRRQTAVGRGGHRYRRTVRRRRTDHRHRRRVRVAHRTGDPRHAFGTQDPARVRRGGGHVGDVRHTTRGGGARDRVAALRVLEPRVRPARRRVERGRRDARRAVRRRSPVPRAAARLRGPRRRSRCSR